MATTTDEDLNFYILYCCTQCDEKFSSDNALKEHLRTCPSSVDTSWIKQEKDECEKESVGPEDETSSVMTTANSDHVSCSIKTERSVEELDQTAQTLNRKPESQDPLPLSLAGCSRVSGVKSSEQSGHRETQSDPHCLLVSNSSGTSVSALDEFEGASTSSSLVTSLDSATSVAASTSKSDGEKPVRVQYFSKSGISLNEKPSFKPQFESFQFVQEGEVDPSLPRIERVYYTSVSCPNVTPEETSSAVSSGSASASNEKHVTTQTAIQSQSAVCMPLKGKKRKAPQQSSGIVVPACSLSFTLTSSSVISGSALQTAVLPQGANTSVTASVSGRRNQAKFRFVTPVTCTRNIAPKPAPDKQKAVVCVPSTSVASCGPLVTSSQVVQATNVRCSHDGSVLHASNASKQNTPIMAVLPQTQTASVPQPAPSTLNGIPPSFPTPVAAPVQNVAAFPAGPFGQLAYPYIVPLAPTAGGLFFLPPVNPFPNIISQPPEPKASLEQPPQTASQPGAPLMQTVSPMIQTNTPLELTGIQNVLQATQNFVFMPGNLLPQISSSRSMDTGTAAAAPVGTVNAFNVQNAAVLNQSVLAQTSDAPEKQMMSGIQLPVFTPVNVMGTAAPYVAGTMPLNAPGIASVNVPLAPLLNNPGTPVVNSVSAGSGTVLIPKSKFCPLSTCASSSNSTVVCSGVTVKSSYKKTATATSSSQNSYLQALRTQKKASLPALTTSIVQTGRKPQSPKKNDGADVMLGSVSATTCVSSKQIRPVKLLDGHVLVPVAYSGLWKLKYRIFQETVSTLKKRALLPLMRYSSKPEDIFRVVRRESASGQVGDESVYVSLRKPRGHDHHWVLLGEDGVKLVWAPSGNSQRALVIPVSELPEKVTQEIKESIDREKNLPQGPANMSLVTVTSEGIATDSERTAFTKSTVSDLSQKHTVRQIEKGKRRQRIHTQTSNDEQTQGQNGSRTCASISSTKQSDAETRVDLMAEGTKFNESLWSSCSKSSLVDHKQRPLNEASKGKAPSDEMDKRIKSVVLGEQRGGHLQQETDMLSETASVIRAKQPSIFLPILPKVGLSLSPVSSAHEVKSNVRHVKPVFIPILPKTKLTSGPVSSTHEVKPNVCAVGPGAGNIPTNASPRLTVLADPAVIKHALDAVVHIEKLKLRSGETYHLSGEKSTQDTASHTVQSKTLSVKTESVEEDQVCVFDETGQEFRKKRKRCHPCKHVHAKETVEQASACEETHEKLLPETRRKRGCPSKYICAEEDARNYPTSYSVQKMDECRSKRKWGRPRKNLPVVEDQDSSSSTVIDSKCTGEKVAGSEMSGLRRSLRLFLKPEPDYSGLEYQQMDQLLEDVNGVSLQEQIGSVDTHQRHTPVRKDLDEEVVSRSPSKVHGKHSGFYVYVERGDDDRKPLEMECDTDRTDKSDKDEGMDPSNSIRQKIA